MEQFTEEHAKRLLGKEWLAKTDAGTSTPYLFKYSFTAIDLSCVIMVTDTKKVWAEVVNEKILARRWRACNPRSPELFATSVDEESWREKILDLLSKAHTIGGIGDPSFEVVESKYSDLCIELEWDTFKWRWEANFLGYSQSSEIVSRHLVLPLISLNHLTFSTSEVIGDMQDADVEKTLDKLGKTARRTVDTHIKNSLSKPRLATCISRMTALFNFLQDLPRVTSISEKPLLELEEVEAETTAVTQSTTKTKGKYVISPKPSVEPVEKQSRIPPTVDPDSVTESDSDEPASKSGIGSRAATAGPSVAVQGATLQHPARPNTPPLSRPADAKLSSDSDSIQRPIKKIKKSVPDSSDDDSDNGPKKLVALGGGTKRGTRQPVKRGGKRF